MTTSKSLRKALTRTPPLLNSARPRRSGTWWMTNSSIPTIRSRSQRAIVSSPRRAGNPREKSSPMRRRGVSLTSTRRPRAKIMTQATRMGHLGEDPTTITKIHPMILGDIISSTTKSLNLTLANRTTAKNLSSQSLST